MKYNLIAQAFFFLNLLANLAVGQVYTIRSSDIQAVEDQILILEEGEVPLSFQQVHQRSDFVPLHRMTSQLEGERNYWLKLNVYNRTSNNAAFEWVIRMHQSITYAEAYYALEGKTTDQEQLSGFFTPVAQRTFAPILKANLFKFTLEPEGVQTIYIRARSDRATIAPDFHMTIEGEPAFLHKILRKKQTASLFIGFCLMMLIYALILRVYSKDRTYGYYAVYLIGLAGYVAYVSGDAHDLIIPTLLPDHPKFIYLVKLSTYIGFIGYMSFIRSFLDLQKKSPFWDKAFKWLSWTAVAFLLLDLSLMLTTNFSYKISDWATLPYAFLFALFSLPFIVVLLRMRDRMAHFVLTGLLCMGAGMVATAVARLQSPDYSVTGLEIGAGFELVIFSLGLAYRQQKIRRQQQRAQFELEKSQLIQKQNELEIERQQELYQLKTDLYTNITHELRTPLTVIMGMLDNISEHEREKKLIERNTRSLLHLVNQVMDLSQLDAGKLELHYQQADIIPFLRYLCESFQSNSEAKNLQLVYQAESKELFMDFDEAKIQQIVYNLLSNAIKFTPASGQIDIRVRSVERQDQLHLALEIEDSGTGIPPEDLEHIFDRFYQSKLHAQYQQGGSGIGLAVTRELVQLMKGEIEVSSELGKGTTFCIYLPIRREAPTSNKPLPLVPDRISDAEKEETGSGLVTDNQDLSHVLIVEDNPDVSTYIQDCLNGKFSISTAMDGLQGKEQAFEDIPDIILCDVMMPGMNGYELCQTLKEDRRTSHIPIIMLTAKAEEKDRLNGLRFGADAYLTKPFNREELLIRVEKLLELRDNLRKYHLRSDLLQLQEQDPPENPELLFLQQLRDKVIVQLDNAEFGVKDLGKAVNLGHTQVYRKLKALTGLTPKQFIRDIRLRHAAQMLARHQHTVAEVAYAVGFSDPNYFSRIFQQTYGHPPSEH
ncbi:MAG: ATP-binding protein [Saprospiraceae bacterium]|nr:response regulator [Lewinella sp.]